MNSHLRCLCQLYEQRRAFCRRGWRAVTSALGLVQGKRHRWPSGRTWFGGLPAIHTSCLLFEGTKVPRAGSDLFTLAMRGLRTGLCPRRKHGTCCESAAVLRALNLLLIFGNDPLEKLSLRKESAPQLIAVHSQHDSGWVGRQSVKRGKFYPVPFLLSFKSAR